MIAQIVVNSVVSGSAYSLIAFGFTLIYGTMNFFNMAFGTTVLSGAYAFYIFYRLLKLPLAAGAVLACVLTVLLMLAVDRSCYYAFRQKRVPAWTNVAASMAVGILLQSIVTMLFGSKSLPVYPGIPQTYAVLGAYITFVQFTTVACAAAVVVAAALFLRGTRTGRLIRAIANNKFMSQVVGVDVERAYRAIIVVSTILATFAGIMMGLNTDIRPALASSALLKAIVCSCVGGVGNIPGAMLAGLLLGFLENAVVLLLGSGWRDAIPLLLIVVFMLLRPSAFGIEEAG